MTDAAGRRRPLWMDATVVGVPAGALYTLSPTTFCFLLLLPVLFIWAQRGLGPRERRWILGLMGVAVFARLVALGGFFLFSDHFKEPYGVLIGDERFILDRSLWMLHLAQAQRLETIDHVDTFGRYGQSGIQDMLAYWQLWFGPAVYGAHLLSVAMWLTGAIALHRTARRAFGPLAALGGFAIVLFMPTLFVWSISALKEPPYFFLTAVSMAGAMAVVRGRRTGIRVASAALVVLAVAAIATLRSIALAVTAGGLALAAFGWLATRRAWVSITAVLLIAAASVWALRQEPIRVELLKQFRIAAMIHVGHARTPGYGYWLLDPHFYTRLPAADTDPLPAVMAPAEAVRFSIRSAMSFFTVPLPWNAASRPAVLLLPQQVAWYALAALAGVGIVAGWRRDAIFTWVLVGNALLGGAAVALYNGNVGTMVRMRDSVVPVIVWVGVLGGCAMLDWAARSLSREPRHGSA